jgi:hypothetical protein
MPRQFIFTKPKFTAAGVAQEIGAALGRRLTTYQEPDDDEDLDGAVDVTARVHVQVGADYLIVCAWKDDQTLVSRPARSTVAETLQDLRAVLSQYPGPVPVAKATGASQ